MTYHDVARRMVDLFYLSKRSQWIDPSYIRIFGDFVRRIEERLPLTDWEHTQPIFNSYTDFDEPFEVLRKLAHSYKDSQTQLINQEDQNYFLAICSRTGQKPVPFIPILDSNFETWFKKDSLWQSECVDAVVDEDVQRTCILQGPVAVTYATPQNIDEPIKTILDRINESHKDSILRQVYSGNTMAIPKVEFFGHHIARKPDQQRDLFIVTEPNATTFEIPAHVEKLPSPEGWLELLAGEKLSSRYALFSSKYITSGHSILPNPLQQAFAPARNLSVKITEDTHYDRVSIAMSINNTVQIDVQMTSGHGNKIIVHLHCYEKACAEPLSLEFRLSYHPETPYSLLHEDIEGRTDRIIDFYKKLWLSRTYKTPVLPEGLQTCVVNGGGFLITQDLAKDFAAIISGGVRCMDEEGFVPMDLAIVVGWKAIVKALLLVQGDLLKLVHLSNRFRMYPGAAPLRVGDVTESFAHIISISISETDKTVEICATISRNHVPVIDIISRFFYRGIYTNFAECFSMKKEDIWEINLASPGMVSLLLSKEYITWNEHVDIEELAKQTVTFELETFSSLKSKDVYSRLRTEGKILASSNKGEIATVHYDSSFTTTCNVTGNPVIGYLERYGRVLSKRRSLESPEKLNNTGQHFTFTAPAENSSYARVSGDYNPIHVLPAFAKYAGLPGPITHGMHISAIIRSNIEMSYAGNDKSYMRDFSAIFIGMIEAGDIIEVHVNHVAMLEGNKIFQIEAHNTANQEKVFAGECEIEPIPTAYVFTGQGSQQMGMGMDLYETSSAAREVWNRADEHYDKTYGMRLKSLYSVRKLTLINHRLSDLRNRAQEPEDTDDSLWRQAGSCHSSELYVHDP
jgi:fatty acid synthase subunit beta